MATTYTIIDKTTITSSGGETSIYFTSIPATYTDLKIVCSVRTTGAVNFDILNMQFNGDTGNNYTTRTDIYGYNGTTGSGAASTKDVINVGYIDGGSATANTFCNAEIYIPNYTLTDRVKTVSVDIVEEINSSSNYLLALNTSYWNTTNAAINQIRFLINSGDPMAQYSSFYLYGIKNS